MHKHFYSLLAAFIFTALTVNAQKKTSPKKYADIITPALLQQHLYVIASAEMQGRNTPSPGLEKAATYIEQQFKANGLTAGNKNSYRQYFDLSKDSVLACSIAINDNIFNTRDDFAPLNSSGTLQDVFLSEFVYAGYGIVDTGRDDYQLLDVTGKLVVIRDGVPDDFTPSGKGMESSGFYQVKIRNAQKRGASAVLLIDNGRSRTLLFRNRGGGYKIKKRYAASLPIPAFLISQKIFDTLIAANGSYLNPPTGGTFSNNIEIAFNKKISTTSTSNVIGIVEGTDKKDQYVIITGHYDHLGMQGDSVVYYGADDDGSGTTAVIALSKAFAQAKADGHGPRRTLIFMTVCGEEKGLWGSYYYSQNPIYPLQATSANLNIDMIGRIGSEYAASTDSANYVYTIGEDKLSSELFNVSDKGNEKIKLQLDRKYNDPNDRNRFYYRSDHYNFALKGVPIIFYFNGTHADYHQPGDTPDKINYGLMARRAQLVFYTAWEIANRDDMLKRDIPLKK